MGTATRWARLDAKRGVHLLLVLVTVLWTLLAAWTFLVGLFTGFAAFAVVPGGIAVLCGWLTSSWRRGRAWAWWVAAALGAAGFLVYLAGVLAEGPGASMVGLVLTGALLVLLSHPDSVARLRPAATDPGPPSRSRQAP